MITTSYPLAYAAISLLTPDPAPAYTGRRSAPPMQWGWRIPFVLGSLMAFVIYYIREVHESGLEESGGPPLEELFSGQTCGAQVLRAHGGFGFDATLFWLRPCSPLLTSELGLSGTAHDHPVDRLHHPRRGDTPRLA